MTSEHPETVVELKISLLDQVKKGLKADPRVNFAGEIIDMRPGAGWTETVEIYVAPVEPIFVAADLNKFMDSLVKDLPRTTQDAARQYNEKSDFNLGRLYFDETIGVTTTEMKINTIAYEPIALERAGIPMGESFKTAEDLLKRRTWVIVYPTAELAKLVVDYQQGTKDGNVMPDANFEYLHNWLSPEQLIKLKKSTQKSSFNLLKFLRGN